MFEGKYRIDKESDVILDLGIEKGYVTFSLAKENSNSTIIGLDLN